MGKVAAALVASAATTAVAAAEAETKISKRQEWREGTTVTVTEKGSTNPKKPGSLSAMRYEVLLAAAKAANGKPIGIPALFKAGYRMDDVRHDAQHGFIELNQPFEL
jgi:hypothetical protein